MVETSTKSNVIDGTQLDKVSIPYNYAQAVTVWIGMESYRVSADVLLAVLNEFRFKVNQKRVHRYLEIAEYPPLHDVNY